MSTPRSGSNAKRSLFDLDNKVSGLAHQGTSERGYLRPGNNNIVGGKGKSKPATVVVDEDEKQVTPSDSDPLSRYVEVPSSAWKSLPIGTYVRYQSGGELKAGAKLNGKIAGANGQDVFKFIKFIAGSKKPMFWSTNVSAIEKLYKFVGNQDNNEVADANAAISESNTDPRQELMGKLGDKLLFDDADLIRKKGESNERRIEQLETNLKSMIVLVKQLDTKLKAITGGRV
jgi:hypothetical protein